MVWYIRELIDVPDPGLISLRDVQLREMDTNLPPSIVVIVIQRSSLTS